MGDCRRLWISSTSFAIPVRFLMLRITSLAETGVSGLVS